MADEQIFVADQSIQREQFVQPLYSFKNISSPTETSGESFSILNVFFFLNVSFFCLKIILCKFYKKKHAGVKANKNLQN